jgi:hypothetical protein
MAAGGWGMLFVHTARRASLLYSAAAHKVPFLLVYKMLLYGAGPYKKTIIALRVLKRYGTGGQYLCDSAPR